MDIEKIKSTIEKLPESEREEIMKMGELSEEELEKTVGGLSEKTKITLISLGVAALSIALTVSWKDRQNLIAKMGTLKNPPDIPPPYPFSATLPSTPDTPAASSQRTVSQRTVSQQTFTASAASSVAEKKFRQPSFFKHDE